MMKLKGFLRKKQERPQKNIQQMRDTRKDYTLVNYSQLRDFLKYGNRTASHLKQKRMVDVRVRETLMNKPNERDYGKILILLIIGVMAVGTAFIMATQFMNYSEASTSLAACRGDLAVSQGRLTVCQSISPSEPGSEPHQVIPG